MSADQTIYPAGWELRELSDVATVIDCKHVTAQFVPNGFPVISIGELGGRFVDLHNGPRTTHDYYALLAEGARRPQTGDVIMTRNVTIGRCSLVPETDIPFAMGQDVCLVRPKKDKLSSDFLKLILGSQSFARQFESMMAGSTFKRLNVQQVKKLMILTPSLNEQERIARMIVSIEAHAAALDRLLAKKRYVKQGMMQELFTGRTRLPGFTDDWSAGTVQTFAAVTGGGTPATRTSSYWHGGIPWFTPAEIDPAGSGLVSQSERTITLDGLANSSATLLPAGSVLVTSRASLGNCAVADVPLATNQGFASMVPRDFRSTWFLYYWIQQNKTELESRAAGSTFLEISSRKVSEIPILAPDLDEQEAIGEVLKDADTEIQALERRLESARAVKVGMMQELLTGRTRLPVMEEV